ncbi:MAG: hypothetical protein UY48_C0003G0064 [Candidatus Gottesmanbacteria bacterium GW2011_GWB1_49_7]|uniref:Uncharacterized protein n=1 Tax=Candidatus Gottesmanbacteria bacterium GW2011_GWB1_49_7 TaxID=1618448 RepID=A0A0G1YE60_9BACT|nr:MAG: hypothetical protein UY48_C0003G0064 [Candidatus Gottesmanbacteria bacterium GW2011_GWB1_49_7]
MNWKTKLALAGAVAGKKNQWTNYLWISNGFLYATDLETWVKISVDIEGSWALPQNVAKFLKPKSTLIVYGGKLLIETLGITLPAPLEVVQMDATPVWPEVSESKKIKLRMTHLGNAVRFPAKEPSRYALQGIAVDLNTGGVASTDGKHLFMSKDFQDPTTIIPAQVGKLAIKYGLDELQLITKSVTENDKVVTTTVGLCVSATGVQLQTRCLDGEFPDVHRVVPTQFKIQGTVTDAAQVSKVLADLKKHPSFSSSNGNPTGELFITPEGAKIRGGELPERPIVIAQLPEMTTATGRILAAYNLNFLIDILDIGGSMDIEFNNSDGPLVFKGSDSVAVIMPVNMQAGTYTWSLVNLPPSRTHECGDKRWVDPFDTMSYLAEERSWANNQLKQKLQDANTTWCTQCDKAPKLTVEFRDENMKLSEASMDVISKSCDGDLDFIEAYLHMIGEETL